MLCLQTHVRSVPIADMPVGWASLLHQEPWSG
jgi:hypothetical protein